MKIKYQRLTKEEKLEAKKRFMEADQRHNYFCTKLDRLRVIGKIGLFFSVVMFIFDAYTFSVRGITAKVGLVGDVLLFAFCLYFIFGSKSIMEKQINNYIIEEMDKKNGKVKGKKKKFDEIDMDKIIKEVEEEERLEKENKKKGKKA